MRQLKLQETQAELARFQHDILEQEEARKREADVRLRIAPGPKGDRLIISNHGTGTAKDVVFELVVPDGSDSFLIESEVSSLLPVTLLGGQQVSMPIALTMSTALKCLAKISWIDETGMHRAQNLTLTM